MVSLLDSDGVAYEERTYEGYGPGGVAVLVETMTDNINRTIAEIRHLFSRYNGNMSEAGSVGWLFSKKGFISFDKADVDADKIMELALETGAEDINEDDESIDVITNPSSFDQVKKAFDDRGMKYIVAEISMIPQNYVKLEGKNAETMLKLVEGLEDSDDVQAVHANFDISMKEMERLSQ